MFQGFMEPLMLISWAPGKQFLIYGLYLFIKSTKHISSKCSPLPRPSIIPIFSFLVVILFIHETFTECCPAPYGKYVTRGRGKRCLQEDRGHRRCRFIEELTGRSRLVGLRVQQPFCTLLPPSPGMCKGRDPSLHPRMSHHKFKAALVMPSLSVSISGPSSGQGDLRASLLGALDP